MFGGFYFLHFLIQHDLTLTLAWLDISGLLKLIYKVLTYDFDLINRHIYTKSTNLLQPWNTYLVLYFLPIDSITARISDVSKEHRKERMFDGQISRCDNACVMQCNVAGGIVMVCVLFKLPDLPYRALVPPRPPCVGRLCSSLHDRVSCPCCHRHPPPYHRHPQSSAALTQSTPLHSNHNPPSSTSV